MNLILRAHDSVTDPVWSVIILLTTLLIGVTYYIVIMMKEAFAELEEDGVQSVALTPEDNHTSDL